MTTTAEYQDLFDVLATLSEWISSYSISLQKSSGCRWAKSGFDIRRLSGTFTELQYDYEGYVEAELSSGKIYIWSINVGLNRDGWLFQRSIERYEESGAQVVFAFDDIALTDIQELQALLPKCLSEFTDKSAEEKLSGLSSSS